MLNTLYPDYLAEIMSHACQQRMSVKGQTVQQESIQISQFWEEELKSMPYLSRKCPSLLIVLTALSSSQKKMARPSIS